MEGLYNWAWVTRQVTQTTDAWDACTRQVALPGPRFTPQEQQKHEIAYNEGLRAVEQEAKRSPRTRAERLRAQRRIVGVFPGFASIALGLDDDAIQLLTNDFIPVGTNVARWASRFDPTLSMPDIIQACRNAWTACGMQPLLGDRLRITPSILGYSLLYPYSDNHMDHPLVSTEDKLHFSDRFRRRLSGLPVLPANHHEAAVWAMVELIELEYPRAQYPQVYAGLLPIHRAQEESIAQLHGCSSISDHELLRLSCAKGGASVLADACLSHGSLTAEESHFAFDWGVLLQLGDDLQDLHDDLKNGSRTLFTRAAAAGTPLDNLVLQLLVFSDRVAAQMDNLPNGDSFLKHLLRMSWRSLIYMAVANAPEYFTPEFLTKVESCSQFRFRFLRAKRKRFSGRRGLYSTIFDAFIQAGDVDSSALPVPERWKERCVESTVEAVAKTTGTWG